MHGLTETQQSVLMFIAVSLITVNIYISTLPPEEMPRSVIVIMGALSAIAVVAKEQFGAKKAEVAEKAKTVINPP